MKHRNHMIPCVIIAVAAMSVLALSGRAPLGAGIGLTLLLCPLLMGTVMWLLMRQPHGPATHDRQQIESIGICPATPGPMSPHKARIRPNLATASRNDPSDSR